MITQEIKIHEEPVPTYQYTPPANYKNNNFHNYNNLYGTAWDDVPTEAEFQLHLKMAKERFKVGQRYRYKTGCAMIEIVGFENNREKSAIYGETPGVVQGKRVAVAGEYAPVYNYSINEIEDMMEVV